LNPDGSRWPWEAVENRFILVHSKQYVATVWRWRREKNVYKATVNEFDQLAEPTRNGGSPDVNSALEQTRLDIAQLDSCRVHLSIFLSDGKWKLSWDPNQQLPGFVYAHVAETNDGTKETVDLQSSGNGPFGTERSSMPIDATNEVLEEEAISVF
jgi:hypothetical protein